MADLDEPDANAEGAPAPSDSDGSSQLGAAKVEQALDSLVDGPDSHQEQDPPQVGQSLGPPQPSASGEEIDDAITRDGRLSFQVRNRSRMRVSGMAWRLSGIFR